MIKIKKYFINNFVMRPFALGVAVSVGFIGTALAATSNGCSLDKNNRINPEIALCTTHVYNIGQVQNQQDENARQAMRDVIALKTTVMTQQLEKQYDFLDATVRRLKTQLEKAVLTASLQAAGASSSSSSSSSSLSGGTNNGITGAEDCITAGLTSDVMSCLSRNIDRITNAINNSDIGAARRQIEKDLETLKLYDKLEKGKDDKGNQTQTSLVYQNVKAKCDSAFNTNNRNTMTECVNLMRVCVSQNIELLQNQNRNNSQQYR